MRTTIGILIPFEMGYKEYCVESRIPRMEKKMEAIVFLT